MKTIFGGDLNCGGIYQTYLVEAVKKGLLSEEEIDKSLSRLLMAKTLAKMGHHEGFTLDMVELVEYNNIPCKTNTFRS